MRSALRALSIGRSVTVIAGAGVDEIDAGEVPAGDPQSKLQESAVGGGDLEANPLDGDRAVASTLFARDFQSAQGASEGVRAGRFAADTRAAQIPVER